MRFCFSYKCKEEQERYKDLEQELHFEQELHHKLRKEHDKLIKENQRLSNALHDSTEAYNKAVAGGKKKPGRKKIAKEIKESEEETGWSMSKAPSLFDMILQAGMLNAKKPQR